MKKINLNLKNCLIPCIIILFVVLIKQVKPNLQKNLQNKEIENFEINKNLIPTTIDNRTVNMIQNPNSSVEGNSLFLGSIPQSTKGYALFLEILPSPSINGKMQIGFTVSSNGTKKCYHEGIFGEKAFEKIVIHKNMANSNLDMYLVKNEGYNYTEPIPLTITCSGNLKTANVINLNDSGVSVLEPRDFIESSDNIVSQEIETKITRALREAGISKGTDGKKYINIDNLKVSDKWTIRNNNSNSLEFVYKGRNKPNLKINQPGSITVKTNNDNGGNHLRNTLYWCTHSGQYKC